MTGGGNTVTRGTTGPPAQPAAARSFLSFIYLLLSRAELGWIVAQLEGSQAGAGLGKVLLKPPNICSEYNLGIHTIHSVTGWGSYLLCSGEIAAGN